MLTRHSEMIPSTSLTADRPGRHSSAASSGVTLIELLAMLSIIAVLLALLIPAVQQSREAARRTQCLSNLRQIGVGLQNYAAREGVFPSAFLKTNVRWTSQGVSAFVRILPELEQSSVFHSINFEANQRTWQISAPNRTAAATHLEIFLCPSDQVGPLSSNAASGTYRINMGSSADSFPRLYEPLNNGAFAWEEWVRPSEFVDGLTATSMVSERIRGGGDPSSFHADRDYLIIPIVNFNLPTPTVISFCLANRHSSEAHYPSAGWSWFLSSYSTTSYNHVRPPNAAEPDCMLNPVRDGMRGGADAGIHSARSRHNGGVHVLCGDGSARWCSNGMSPEAWRALGTRAGGDFAH